MSREFLNLLQKGSFEIGCSLSDQALSQFQRYMNDLQVWNTKMNLIGMRNEKACIVNLFIDSLAGLKVLPNNPALFQKVLDIGTGAGFPGLPLKIANSRLQVTLVEPNLKKVAFLHHVIGVLGLSGVEVETSPIEGVHKKSPPKEFFDCVVTKALRFTAFLPYLTPLIHSDTQVVLFRAEHLDSNENLFGFRIFHEIVYELPFGFGKRVLTILKPTKFEEPC